MVWKMNISFDQASLMMEPRLQVDYVPVPNVILRLKSSLPLTVTEVMKFKDADAHIHCVTKSFPISLCLFFILIYTVRVYALTHILHTLYTHSHFAADCNGRSLCNSSAMGN